MRKVKYQMALDYALRIKMERLKKGTYKQLQRGKDIHLSDLNKCGNDLVQVVEELKNEWVTGQFTLPFTGEPQEMILHRLNPIVDTPTSEQKHLMRTDTPKNNNGAVTRTITTDERNLEYVREQLRNI